MDCKCRLTSTAHDCPLFTLTQLQVIPEGCTAANPGLEGCADERGYLFHSNQSTTWSTEGLQNGKSGVLYQLIAIVEGWLGFGGNAYYGYDTISLGVPGSGLPTVEHQLIAGFATNDFWLGSLGLSPLPFNFSDFNDPLPSLLHTLRSQSVIPSTSWGYTAGAYYKDPPIFGSLTLGGYDKARAPAESPNITLPFGPDISKDLLVPLSSITYDTAGASPLMTETISVFIDSLVTDLWLPVSVCTVFEQNFGLTWNSTAESYLLDDETHEALLAQNPTFCFSFGDEGSGNTVNIDLPYAAFDLEMRPPLVDQSTRYFPLKRAQNETQYVLGRTFLQEAYVVADYDRRQFSISQAAFPEDASSSEIVSIHPPDQEENEKTIPNPGKEDGLSTGVIVAIILSSLGFVGLAGAAFYLIRRRRAKKSREVQEMDGTEVAEKRWLGHSRHQSEELLGDSVVAFSELDGRESWMRDSHGYKALKHRSELSGSTMSPRELESSEPVWAELDGRNWNE